MNDTTTLRRGKATPEELAELHGLLVASLREVLAPKDRSKAPSAELLGVTRKTLRDNGMTCPDEASRRALQTLYRAYLRRIAEALEVPEGERVPAAVLSEARALLAWHGAADLPAAAGRKVAQQLLAANVPFKVRH